MTLRVRGYRAGRGRGEGGSRAGEESEWGNAGARRCAQFLVGMGPVDSGGLEHGSLRY